MPGSDFCPSSGLDSAGSQISSVYRMGGGASLFSHRSLLRERGDPVSQGILPRECGLGKEPFFFPITLTRVETSIAPSPNLSPPPSPSPRSETPPPPSILLHSFSGLELPTASLSSLALNTHGVRWSHHAPHQPLLSLTALTLPCPLYP